MATDIHAEHVGSLLRQPWLLEAKAKYKAGATSLAELREAEDRAAAENIAMQQAVGMPVFTDGEVRRNNWMAGLLESIGGMTSYGNPDGVVWHRADGEVPPHEETDFDLLVASERVYQKQNLTAVEAAYLAEHAPGSFKVTLMSAAMGGMVWRPEISSAVYPSPAELTEDLVRLQVEEIAGLIDIGTRWVQLDSLSYNQVMDRRFREATGSGVPAQVILDASVKADTAIVAGVKAKDPTITVGMHICRGNNRSAYMAAGSYEPVAERLFSELPVDRFLLEYDTDRAGGFEPLRFVPPGRTVVLGLITSKSPVLESLDNLRRRVDEASRYVDGDDLAISPQCGFASTSGGNQLTRDEQKAKLELALQAAQAIWG
ncbi:MAG TPA: cobalamin-independent methionine synthase II family protein [Trebonia sp.]|nr:cobalamin-independent methionine synthase II family protein [Trebonia sp.]